MKMTIAKKLGLGFGIVLLIFTISGVVTVALLGDIGSHLNDVISVAEPATILKISDNVSFVPGLYHQISMDDSVCKRNVTYCILSMKYKF